MKRSLLLCTLLLLSLGICAQTTLQTSGINEAQFIYRTAPDSLNAYFRDSFAFNMSYRNLSFGLKFIAELPKYSVNQDELIDELAEDQLSLGWKELYLRFNRDNLMLQAGTMSETFGSGMLFRTWEDIEFDEDHRLQGLLVSYDNKLKIKALYGALPNPQKESAWDLAYGTDFYYPLTRKLNLGASALALRTRNQSGSYNQRDVFGIRTGYSDDLLEANLEYAVSNYYGLDAGLSGSDGSALYGSLTANLYPIQIGVAGKRYDQFSYRLQDLPMANYHSEPLLDTSSGLDEIGLQGWLNWNVVENLSWNLDYAEAWNADRDIFMNDLHSSVDFSMGSTLLGAEYSHIEMHNETEQTWSKELTPALNAAFPAWGRTLSLKAEHKYLRKQKMETIEEIFQPTYQSHWEPHLQADYSLGKFAFSASASSHWTDMGELANSRYWTNLEIKYSAFSHTDLSLFVGKEAGGKVCRNGVCRYVAPFEGLKLDLSTRF